MDDVRLLDLETHTFYGVQLGVRKVKNESTGQADDVKSRFSSDDGAVKHSGP